MYLCLIYMLTFIFITVLLLNHLQNVSKPCIIVGICENSAKWCITVYKPKLLHTIIAMNISKHSKLR